MVTLKNSNILKKKTPKQKNKKKRMWIVCAFLQHKCIPWNKIEAPTLNQTLRSKQEESPKKNVVENPKYCWKNLIQD